MASNWPAGARSWCGRSTFCGSTPRTPLTAAWDGLRRGLAPGGVIVEGTCDELGRIGSWVMLDADGPRALTLSCAPPHLDRPATLAERLPKALIHHNVPGQPIHRLIADLDAGWAAAAPLAVFSADAAVAGRGAGARRRRLDRAGRAAGTPAGPGDGAVVAGWAGRRWARPGSSIRGWPRTAGTC